MIQIAFLIPVKTTQLDDNSHIYKLLYNFSKNINIKYKYNFYIGFNYNDKCLNNKDILDIFNNDNLTIQVIEFNNTIKSGHLTKMWNELFEISYNENDYFYQLGDDIIFENYNFLDIYIARLNNNIGVTGYLTKNKTNILTQSFVSKTHYLIFGFYFPESIKNWFCDDWISNVYKKFNLYKPLGAKIINNGGCERYSVEGSNKKYLEELKTGSIVLGKYLDTTPKKY